MSYFAKSVMKLIIFDCTIDYEIPLLDERSILSYRKLWKKMIAKIMDFIESDKTHWLKKIMSYRKKSKTLLQFGP
jgi:hypothetical protein